MSLDAPRTPAPTAPVLFVDVHSGRGARFDSFDEVRALLACVVRRIEGEGLGRRFPLLHVVEGRRTLAGTECEALVWELARVRTILSMMPADDVTATPTAGVVAAAVAGARRTLADVHGTTILSLDRAARLGAASRRGARFEAVEGALVDGAVTTRGGVEER